MSVSPNRLDAVERVRRGWIGRLIDLSRRNNLLYYRESIAGSIELTESDRIDTLLRGESVPLVRLVSPEERERSLAGIQKIYRRSLTNLEEKGLQTLFLALGMASWTPDDAGRPPEAAVILVPVQVEIRGAIQIRRSGEAQINPVLLHVLYVEYGCRITPQDLLEGAESIAEDEYPDLSIVADRFQEIASEIEGFEIKPRRVLGNFSFQKMAMVRDLRERLQEMADHNLIAAIAGDEEARRIIRGDRREFDAKELDTTFRTSVCNTKSSINEERSAKYKYSKKCSSGRSRE